MILKQSSLRPQKNSVPLWLASFNFSTSCKAGILLLVIDRDPQCNTYRVKEKIHIRLHSNNINRDSRIEIPEAWLPLIKKHSNRRSVQQWTSEAKALTNNGVRNAPISAANNRPTRTRAWSNISSRVTSRRRLARQAL